MLSRYAVSAVNPILTQVDNLHQDTMPNHCYNVCTASLQNIKRESINVFTQQLLKVLHLNSG